MENTFKKNKNKTYPVTPPRQAKSLWFADC